MIGRNEKELTQEEYDALTKAQKNNGTVYFITDGTIMFNGAQYGGSSGSGFEYKNRESVDTGNVWIDGRHIKVFCFSYSGQSGNNNSVSLTDFGFNDTINNYVDIKTQYLSSAGEFHAQGGYCYSWRATNDRITTYINLDGTIYIQFYYT